MSLKKYVWENWASTDDLATIFGVSKRRIQQIVATMLDKGLCETVIGVFYDPRNPYAKPFYRIVKI